MSDRQDEPASEALNFYETPDGVAVRSSECTIYVNVGVSRRDARLACFRINKRLPNGKHFVVTFDLDEEMTKLLASRAYAIAGNLEKE